MDIDELIKYRKQLLEESKDPEGYISDAGFIENCIPALNETKYIDTTDVNHIYEVLDDGKIKINAYTINESGERLQLFIVNEGLLKEDAEGEDILISQRSIYESQFNRALTFLKKALKKQLGDKIQQGAPSSVLLHQLASAGFMEQIDVVEIFLLSPGVSVQRKANSVILKSMEFDDEDFSISYTIGKDKHVKNLIILKRLIDVNFLYNVYLAEGNREPLIIRFSDPPFNFPLPCLKAASEDTFDSYLCVLPATLLAELFKRYSSRLLEKNVRSFLQLKGVNKSMQETIKTDPEKFIAYNNGLTITATSCEHVTDGGKDFITSLTDFQIVNGGQTTATLYFSQKGGLRIEKISVMAKINVAKGASEEVLDDLISNISTYSNAQSKVSKVDLRARSPQLMKIKALSDSITTVSGKKWFFERAKGEYATTLRIHSGRKAQIEKQFPRERRFTKEDLAKYYAAWGEKPFAVKKGGEKIFRLFLEEISGEGRSKKSVVISRSFYEDLIARIIMFRELERIYGTGNAAMGQLRSAVVPYSLSVLYAFSTGGRKTKEPFDLIRIWKSEKLDDDLRTFFSELMKLMNGLIRQYSKSDDLGEYAKKEELWEDIRKSEEVNVFMSQQDVVKLLRKYSVSPEEQRRRENAAMAEKLVEFGLLLENASIHDKGEGYYQHLMYKMFDKLQAYEHRKLESIIASIRQCQMLDESLINFENSFIKGLLAENPILLDQAEELRRSSDLSQAASLIIGKYNSIVAAESSISGAFLAFQEMARNKGMANFQVFGEIGATLEKNELPSIRQLVKVAEYERELKAN